MNIEQALKPPGKQARNFLSLQDLQTYESKIQIFVHIFDMFKKTELKSADLGKEATDFVEFLALRLHDCDMTNQLITDTEPEIKRLSRILQLLQIRESKPLAVMNPNAKETYNAIYKLVYSVLRYTDNHDAVVQKTLIKEKEKIEITRALGMEQGHWFKCPNGHLYVIADCGGAMEVSKCNECGAKIGGTNHQLLADNVHSGDMDGSRHAAWSEAANLQNYAHF